MKVELMLTETKGYLSRICDRCGKFGVNTTLYQVKNKGWSFNIYNIEVCENCYEELMDEK